jgi:hypothetical protein
MPFEFFRDSMEETLAEAARSGAVRRVVASAGKKPRPRGISSPG